MLQKTAIEPRALELLKRLQADKIFNMFHLAGYLRKMFHNGLVVF